MAMTQVEIDAVKAGFDAVKADVGRRIKKTDMASAAGLAWLPPGTVVSTSTGSSRPTSRADIRVVFYTSTQPTAMLTGDQWVQTG